MHTIDTYHPRAGNLLTVCILVLRSNVDYIITSRGDTYCNSEQQQQQQIFRA